MPSYSSTSRRRLATCHRELQVLFNEVIKEDDCSILCGHRDEAAQREAYEAGTSMLTWPDSNHNQIPSMAVDVTPYFTELGNVDWNDIKAMCVFAGKVMIVARRLLAEGRITHRLRWGGDWDGDGRTVDQKFHDLPHYELIPAGTRGG